MNWIALKSDECPACASHLKQPDSTGLVKCENEDCEFKIREARMKEIVEQMEEDAEFERHHISETY